jgi:hypothetical protein
MTDSNNENETEVKEFTQTVKVVPTKYEELVDDETENETPSSSSDEENDPEPEEEEAEEESEEESEEEAEEESEEEPEAEALKPEPKPVEGESPRERALRLEVERVKGLLRKERTDELFVKRPSASQIDEELKEYDPEELKRFEKIASKMGFAKKDEILHESTQEKLNAEFESFIDAHPEYAPENDKDGLLWNQLKSEFTLYNPPKDPKTLRKVLNKVHNDVFGVQPATNLSKINASREKIKVASHTGASAGKETKTKTQSPSGLRLDGMKGFSEEEIAELLG